MDAVLFVGTLNDEVRVCAVAVEPAPAHQHMMLPFETAIQQLTL